MRLEELRRELVALADFRPVILVHRDLRPRLGIEIRVTPDGRRPAFAVPMAVCLPNPQPFSNSLMFAMLLFLLSRNYRLLAVAAGAGT